MNSESHEQLSLPQSPTPTAREPSFSWKVGPATGVLIGISVVVGLLSGLGSDRSVLDSLFMISEADAMLPGSATQALLAELAHCQVWRLLTPIFIHFGLMHLLFNMLWMKDLGTAIEHRLGSRMLLTLVVVMGLLANLGQFLLVGPFFGGMSGVVYGLLGFVWMKSRFDPASGFQLHRQTVYWMIGWFVLCLTGALGPVANAAHGVGLVSGIVWGFISAKTRRTEGETLPNVEPSA